MSGLAAWPTSLLIPIFCLENVTVPFQDPKKHLQLKEMLTCLHFKTYIPHSLVPVNLNLKLSDSPWLPRCSERTQHTYPDGHKAALSYIIYVTLWWYNQ